MTSKTHPDENGYLRFNDSNKLVHLWVAKNKYGDIDYTNKEIHHLDGDKTNNNKDNLVLLDKYDHFLLEQYQRKYLCKNKKVIKEWAFILFFIIIIIQLLYFWNSKLISFMTFIIGIIILTLGIKEIV